MKPAAMKPAPSGIDPAAQLKKGIARHQAGDLDRAEALYRSVLRHNPGHDDAQHLLGLVLHQRGQHEEAMRLIRGALRASPRQAIYHNNLGGVLRALGRDDEAEQAFLAAIGLKPDYAEPHFNIAGLWFGQGKAVEAIAAYREALRINPAHYDAWRDLGQVLQKQGELDEAIHCFRRAAHLRPASHLAFSLLGFALHQKGEVDAALANYREALRLHDDPETRSNLAAALLQKGRFDEALAELRYVVRRQPGQVRAHNNLGAALMKQVMHSAQADTAKLEEAVAAFRRALALDPEYLESWRNLGASLKIQGRFDEAGEAFRAALRLAPDFYANYAGLLTSGKVGPEMRDEVLQIESMLETAPPSEKQTISLHFALGKAFDDLEDHARAFRHYEAGNRLRRAQFRYAPADTVALVDAIIATYDREFFASRAGWGEASGQPLFIVGMPRSGTTLVEQILSSHPQVVGAGELAYMQRIEEALPGTEGMPPPARAARLSREDVVARARDYLERLAALPGAAAARRISDKMPGNFLRLGLIALLLPHARVIYCRREPMDNCLSIYFQNFSGAHPYAYDLAELGAYWREHERLMEHWRAVLPLPMIEVRYEEVVGDFETQARRIVDFAGLPWDARCLEFHKTERPVVTASAWQVRQPLYASSVARWRPYASWLGPLAAALGL